MKTSFRQKVRPWLIRHQSIYDLARNTHRTYCHLTSSIHTLPNFIIIGAAKGGTSSLYDYLTQHPSIYSCVVKEPNYFAMYYDRGINWYKSCFPTTLKKYNVETFERKKFVTGEASTQYYWYPHTPKRIKKILPKVKLILLLRNPIDRSFSHYNMNVNGGKEVLSFEEAIDQEKERTHEEYKKILENEYYFSPKYTLQAYLAKSIYVNFLSEWLKHFSLQQFLIIKSEDFYNNPNKIYNEVLEFLNLPKAKLKNYKITRKGSYDTMNPNTRRKLVEYFRPYNEKLYKLLEKDFEWNN